MKTKTYKDYDNMSDDELLREFIKIRNEKMRLTHALLGVEDIIQRRFAKGCRTCSVAVNIDGELFVFRVNRDRVDTELIELLG